MTTLATMLAAAQRLLSYYNGDEKTAQNPGGLTGVGGMADNWDPCIQDIGTVANGVGDAMTAASTSEGNAAQWAEAAADSAQSAQQDAAATAADRQATGLDRQATAADRQAVAQDKTTVHQDRQAADADAQATAADRQAVAQDKATVHQDRLAADADAQATAADRVATAADRSAVAVEAAAAHADRLAADTAAAAAAAAAATVNLPMPSAPNAGKSLTVAPGGGWQLGTAAATVSQSPVAYMTAGGTTTLTGKSVLAAYEQIAGQTFTVDYNTRASYAESDALNGTALSGGQFTMANMGGASIDANTKLLVHADGVSGSTEIIDERGITPFGTHCGWLDGASQWKIPSSYKLAWGSSQNFTYECWFRAADLSSGYHVLFGGDISGAGVQVALNGSTLYWYNNSTPVNYGTVSADTWYHVALVRYNGTTKLYLNGVGNAGTADTTAYIANPCTLGASGNISYFTGWLDQFRVSKIARYTANFTPSTTPFVTDTDTVHLFSFDDGHGGQVLKDRSGSGHEVALIGGASISTGWSKFGASSLRLVSDNGLRVAGSKGHADFSLGADNFTLDMWARFDAIGTYALVNIGTANTGGQLALLMQANGDGTMRLFLSSNNSSWDIANALSVGSYAANVAAHWALVRNGTTLYVFKDGAQQATVTIGSTAFPLMAQLNLGQQTPAGSGSNMAGYIDEVRLKRGEAAWTSNFTPPTAPYTADDRTILLLHFDGANGDKVTLDSSGASYGTNAFGDTITPALAFQGSPALAATQTRGGHSTSLALNGSGQYASMTFNALTAGHPLYFNTNTKFCIEGWFYMPSLSGIANYLPLFDLRSVTPGIALNIYVLASAQMQANVRSDNSGTILTVNGGIPVSGWNHFAFVREGRGYVLYTNGTAGAAPGSPGSNPYYSGNPYNLAFGAWGDGSGSGNTVAFDAIRITNGQSRYTANFTPGNLTSDDATTMLWVFDGATGQKWVKELSQNTALIAANGNAQTVKDGGGALVPLGSSGVLPTISTAQAKFGTSSMYFVPGNATRLTVPGLASIANFTGDFTVEAWVYPTAYDGSFAKRIVTKALSSTAAQCSWEFNLDSGGKPVFVFCNNNSGGSYTVTGSTGVLLNSWSHIAASYNKTAGTMELYINGTRVATGTGWTLALNASTTPVSIGSYYDYPNTNTIYQGYIDEVRISASARYTGASFTVPTMAYGQQYVLGPAWVATKPGLTALDLSAFSSIDTVACTYATPPNTTLKFLVSTDNYATALKKWNGSAWVSAGYSMTWNSGSGTLTTSATPAQLMAAANTFSELQTGLLAMDATTLTGLNVVAVLQTTNQQFTPSLDALNIGMDEYSLVRPVTDYTVRKKKASGDQTLTITRVAAGNANMVFDYIPAAS